MRKRGAEEAGAVFVKVALLDGNAMLYAPAPQTFYDESRPAERLFAPASPQPVPEQSVEERLAKELRFDPDAWIVETEDRAGRHFWIWPSSNVSIRRCRCECRVRFGLYCRPPARPPSARDGARRRIARAVFGRVTAMVEPRHAASITSADRSLSRS